MKKEIAVEPQYEDSQGCKYYFQCENCPYPKCRYDCRTVKEFVSPMLYIAIRMVYKRFANVALLERIFQVHKATIYRALNEKVEK